MIVADLRRVGLLGRGDRPGPVGHHRILDAYPIYRTGYRDEVARARSALSGVDGLVLGGRTGSFWYNNMDGSIEKALALADRLIES
jgi:protoporphyrinogen oxidase